MNEHTPTSDELEREIDEERGRIARTVEALGDRADPSAMTRQAGDIFERVVQRVVDNPLPSALIAIGLVMIARRSVRDNSSADYDDPLAHDPLYREPYDPYYDEPDPEFAGAGPSFAEPHGATRNTAVFGDDHLDDDDGRGLRDKARDNAEHLRGKARDNAAKLRGKAGAAADEARYRAGSAASGARAQASSAARGVSDRARDARDTAASGLRRADMRRRQATDAAARRAERARRNAASFIDDNPLMAGALAFALGAALGGVTPNTRAEHRALGPHARRLRESARDEARDGFSRARRAAEAAYDEAREIGEEYGHRVADTIPDPKEAAHEAEGAAKRVADAAKAELGKDEKSTTGVGSSAETPTTARQPS
jgi:ElaB/YqjD/DUF883 family membrane-anchored ribosome-binding protein